VIARGPKARKQGVPFGPFLALGGVIALLWGPDIIDWYARISGISG
jgi:leader peptidase (prepilin peptidase) / N-methyltransferase